MSPSHSWTERSPAQPVTKFEPFLILEDEHAKHYRSADIIELESNRIFCPVCLELRAARDIGDLEFETHAKFVMGLLDVLQDHPETPEFRNVSIPLLEAFLSKRRFAVQDDHQLHRIMRILHRLMRSSIYNQKEYMYLAKIMSGLNMDRLKPVPLQTIWDVWAYMLELGSRFVLSDLIDQTSGDIPEYLTKIFLGQAAVITSYLRLVNDLDQDMISEVFFSKARFQSLGKYFSESQMRCIKFAQDVLVSNCECYILRERAQKPLELQAISEMFAALTECLNNSIKRRNERFLDYLARKDVLILAHKILSRNENGEFRPNVCSFIKTYTLYYLDKEYGKIEYLTNFVGEVEIETVANKIEQLVGRSTYGSIYIFYLMLNFVAIKVNSRYYVATRVRRVLTGNPAGINGVLLETNHSKAFIRIFVFVAAASKISLSDDNELTRFFASDWDKMYSERTLSVFRDVYCHEPIVFAWAHENLNFLRLVNCDSVAYLIERGCALNQTVIPLTILRAPILRGIFKRYLLRNSTKFFTTLVPMGSNGINEDAMIDFSHWIPALLQETLLRYVHNPDRRMALGQRLKDLLSSCIYLINNAQRLKFDPYFDDRFVVDFVNLVEITYISATRGEQAGRRRELANQLLIATHMFMAALIISNNECVLHLIKYIDFTLIGYMYQILDNYKDSEEIGDVIARLMTAYNNLDYPLQHRVEDSIYPMFSSVYEWMMSENSDLHALALIMVDKLYSEIMASSQFNHRNFSNSARFCITTGYMHMVCSNLGMVHNPTTKRQILRILEYEEFRYHPYYEYLTTLVPALVAQDDPDEDCASTSSELSFASADSDLFRDEQVSVAQILEQLNDEGYRSASAVNLPKNIYLNGILDNEEPENETGTMDWERRAYETTQASYGGTQHQRT